MRRREVVRIPVLKFHNDWDDHSNRYKQTAASRRRFEDRFQALAKQAFDAAFECRIWQDGDGVGEALAETLCPLLGFSLDDPNRPLHWKELIHPDDSTIVEEHVRRVLGGERDLCVFRGVAASGAIRWFGVLTRPVWDTSGRRVAHTYSVVQDHSAALLSSSPAANPSHRPPLCFPERLF